MFATDAEADMKPTDQVLRDARFEIVDRPRNREPVWRRRVGGVWVTYSESEAWQVLNGEAVQADKKAGKRR